MLAESNLDMDFSSEDKEQNSRDLTLKDYEEVAKTRSQLQFHSPRHEEEKKMKMFNFNNQLKRKNTDIFSNYGFNMEDIMRNVEKEKKNYKKESIEDLSIFSNHTKNLLKN